MERTSSLETLSYNDYLKLKEIITPYISVENDEARISVRSGILKRFRRNDLILKINMRLFLN